jgi:hypothetical protein
MSTSYERLRTRFYQIWACAFVALLLPLWFIVLGAAPAIFISLGAGIRWGLLLSDG